MSTYLDAVLNNHMDVLFNGTPEETVKWLEEVITPDQSWLVHMGRTMQSVSVVAYLTAAKERKEAALKEKRKKVMDLVARAMVKQDVATYRGDTSGMETVGIETTDEIMKIFI
jgi:hypothetical protein